MELNRLQISGLCAAIVGLSMLTGALDMKAEAREADDAAAGRAVMELRMAEQQCGETTEVVQTGRGLRCVGDIYDDTQLAQAPGGAQ